MNALAAKALRYANRFARGSAPTFSSNCGVQLASLLHSFKPASLEENIVATSIADMIEGRSDKPTHGASMAKLGAACVASAGASNLRGSAASITMYPIVPNYRAYPSSGRSLVHTTGEIGLAGHWIKQLLHHVFIYKAKAKPGWWMIPE